MSTTQKNDKSSRFSAYLIAISAVILVGTEVIGIAAATAWAVGGLFHLGALLTWALGAILCGAAAWVTWIFARNAWRVEKEVVSDPRIGPLARD